MLTRRLYHFRRHGKAHFFARGARLLVRCERWRNVQFTGALRDDTVGEKCHFVSLQVSLHRLKRCSKRKRLQEHVIASRRRRRSNLLAMTKKFLIDFHINRSIGRLQSEQR
ncbi:hypothetical protein D6833_11315 [Candidatus Parcubacteria bacterium]|nr:MAG: hypothetical protein D6833_11315 [Candidatus Parcubacteria bacterium]